MDFARVSQALWGTGLMVRGGFHPGPDDMIPETPAPAGSLIIIGNAGEAMWKAFSAGPEYTKGAAGDHPLNAWTERVLGQVARDLGVGVVYPFGGPPYYPFQRWAQKADTVFASPIGPLIHPVYGLWHAYRGALLIPERVAIPSQQAVEHPCESCPDKPCLTTCPVSAFTEQGYDVPHCVGYLESADGGDCIDQGCRARRACPVGTRYHYASAQAAFHQQHFVKANRQTTDREPGF